jgi:hypothetical protein
VNAGRGVFSPVFAYEEPEDLKERAALDELLYKMEVRFTAEHFQENYNLKPSEFTMQAAPEPSAVPGQTAPGEVPFAFAAAPGKKSSTPAYLAEEAQKRLDEAIKKILPEALKASDEFVSKLENAVKTAKSLDALELALADLLAPRMAPSALEDLLARTMTAAAGFGAAAVRAEIEGGN